ncbi:MAG: mandelate racemase/muconate lactonizing enzyme family protein [Treponema sp.]|jgi:L-alanine-DL-glutamate epimerase-like enolase superfamily enzyme|nr:mandelate racemase/muconate lactonizing enzyme family protein [Treponema sp.]
MYKIHKDFSPHKPVSAGELKKIMEERVVDTGLVKKAVVVESAALILCGEDRFLRLRGKDGEEGIAPCASNAEFFYPILRKKVLPYLLGKDARDLETLFFEAFVSDLNYKIQGLPWWCCIAWAESALLDMLAKTAGVPVSALLGGRKRDALELYVASGNRHTTPEEEVEILQQRVNELGMKAIKFKIGGRMRKNADSIAGRSEGLLALARKHFGDGMIIHADGNGSFDAEEGIRMGRVVESINGYFYEEPCPFDDLWDLKKTACALDIPIAFGEQETSLRRFAWIIENDAAQVLQPDLHYTGGFIQCIKISRMAAAAGKVVTPHVSGGYPSYNMLLFCSIIDNPGHYHEYKNFKGVEDHVRGGLAVKDGRIRIPDGTGLGLDLDFVNRPGNTLIFEDRAGA